MGFLTETVLVVRYRGASSETKSLPGGGPQGTLLGLLLFLILINDCGFQTKMPEIGEQTTNKKKIFTPATLHMKYVDDMSILEYFNLEKTLVPNPDRPLPDSFHARLGSSCLLKNQRSMTKSQRLRNIQS